MLAGDRELADCALCGHQYPLRFLVAAHIKKRSICTDAERRDLRNVAMLVCTFGCDALYEAGWIPRNPTSAGIAPPASAGTANVRRWRPRQKLGAGRVRRNRSG